jgi:hypothetical protein
MYIWTWEKNTARTAPQIPGIRRLPAMHQPARIIRPVTPLALIFVRTSSIVK